MIVHGDTRHAADLARAQQIGASALAKAGFVSTLLTDVPQEAGGRRAFADQALAAVAAALRDSAASRGPTDGE